MNNQNLEKKMQSLLLKNKFEEHRFSKLENYFPMDIVDYMSKDRVLLNNCIYKDSANVLSENLGRGCRIKRNRNEFLLVVRNVSKFLAYPFIPNQEGTLTIILECKQQTVAGTADQKLITAFESYLFADFKYTENCIGETVKNVCFVLDGGGFRDEVVELLIHQCENIDLHRSPDIIKSKKIKRKHSKLINERVIQTMNWQDFQKWIKQLLRK